MASNNLARSPTNSLKISQKDQAILLLRMPCAQAAGVDAIVQLGISEGELAPDHLEHLALLTSRLIKDLEELAAFFDDLGIVDHQDGGQHD